MNTLYISTGLLLMCVYTLGMVNAVLNIWVINLLTGVLIAIATQVLTVAINRV